MKNISPVKFTITNYNTIINFKKSNYHNKFKKLTKTQASSSNEKSLVNNSILSTKLNSSESFLFKSIYINNNMRLFRMKNLSIKNMLHTSSSGNKNPNIFKKYIQKKFSDNFKKIKINPELPKMNNFNNFSCNIPYLKPNTGNSNEIQKITFFQIFIIDL